MTEPTFPPDLPPAVAESPVGPEHAHGDHDVHHFPESGLSEGRKPVPKWYWGVFIALSIFFLYYVVTNLAGVQPNSAR
jgi:hypothetical protein